MKRGRARLTLLLLLALTAFAICQPALPTAAGSVEFELGIHGAVVENSWNPLRLVLRDLPPVEFELRIDQGSLRSGSIPLIYSATIDSSRGLTVFEDEVFVPPWSSLSWTVRSTERTIASGTLDPRLRDDRHLTLLLSSEPGRWLTSLPAEARPQEVVAGELPQQAAAYSGVAALLIDGTASAPTLESVVAAAAAGVVVILVGPPPDSHRALVELFSSEPGAKQRLGAGWLINASGEGVAQALAAFDGFVMQSAAAALLTETEALEGPDYRRMTVVAAGALYALLVLLLLRFGGQAGAPAALVVATLTAVAGWLLLRPAEAVLEQERTLVVSTGGLGLSLPTLAVRSLPGGDVVVNSHMRVREALAYRVGGSETRLHLDRWQRQVLLGKPALTSGILVWSGERLENRGELMLHDVLVLGLGPQPPLAPGGAIEVVASEDASSPLIYGALVELLPRGAALASDGTHFVVALPVEQEDSL